MLLYFVFTSPTFCLQFKEFSYLSLFQDYLYITIFYVMLSDNLRKLVLSMSEVFVSAGFEAGKCHGGLR